MKANHRERHVEQSPDVGRDEAGTPHSLRHPDTQAEIDRRVNIYARQVEMIGRIVWMQHRGKERS